MMFALTLAGVLTQLGIPAYAALSDDLHRVGSARDLAQALRAARGHALLHQQVVQVRSLDDDWGSGWRMLLAHSGQVLHEQRLTRRQTIVGTLGNEVRFSQQGIPLRGSGAFLGGTLEICGQSAEAQRRQVVLAPSGRVSLRSEVATQPLCAGN